MTSEAGKNRACGILALSGRSRQVIRQKIKVLINSCQAPSACGHEIGKATRAQFSHQCQCRLLAVFDPEDGLENALKDCLSCLDGPSPVNDRDAMVFAGEGRAPQRLGFVFPGQGSQYARMAADIMRKYPECNALLQQAQTAMGNHRELPHLLYPAPARDKKEKADQEERLRRTDVAQPALGAVSLAMLMLLAHFGVRPDAACGHSYGELTALYCAGGIGRQEFFDLSAARGRFMAKCANDGDGGKMLAIKAPLTTLPELIEKHELDVVLANRNSPEQGVVSGTSEEIERMRSICRKNHIRAVLLPVSAAFHSRLVESAALPFRELLDEVEFRPLQIPVYANTTGRPYPSDPSSARALLGRHLLNPVNFIDDIEAMHADGVEAFVEVGPRPVLTGLVHSILEGRAYNAFALDASGGSRPLLTDLARALCSLAASGLPVALSKWPPVSPLSADP
jgi:acyl transferase domain-containing protein